MACANPTKFCELCPKTDRGEAEMRCMECKVNICFQCFIVHKDTPMLKEHKYMLCDASIPESKEEVHKKELMKEKISNIEKGNQASAKEKLSAADVSKIFEGRSGLEKMLGLLEIWSKPWNVRRVRGSFKDIMGKIQHVKTIGIYDAPDRLAMVNDLVCLPSRDDEYYDDNIISVSVYNKDLVKVNEYKNEEVEWITAIQQVSTQAVIVASMSGLYLCNTEGECLYMIMNGLFTDIQTDGDKVAAISYEENKVVYLYENDNKWQQQQQLVLEDEMYCMYMHKDSLYMSSFKRNKLVEYKDNKLIQTIGSGGSQLGQFDLPFISGSDDSGHLIVCDYNNHRFQLLDPESGNCQQFTLERIKKPIDIMVVQNSVYILHKDIGPDKKLSKYTINNI